MREFGDYNDRSFNAAFALLCGALRPAGVAAAVAGASFEGKECGAIGRRAHRGLPSGAGEGQRAGRLSLCIYPERLRLQPFAQTHHGVPFRTLNRDGCHSMPH
jgi:hypothetical protein